MRLARARWGLRTRSRPPPSPAHPPPLRQHLATPPPCAVTASPGLRPQPRAPPAGFPSSVRASGLAGPSQYTFQIVASNSVGSSPGAITNAVTPTGSTSTYFTTVHGDSPTAYWRLDDPSGSAASDSSGNGHDGTYNGSITHSPTSPTPSAPDTALSVT